MAFKDILVTLMSYPEPTPGFIIENAILIADALGAHIAALSCEVHVKLPGHFPSGSVVGLPGVIAGEAGKSRRNAQDLIAAFEAAAAKSSVSRESTINKCNSFEVPDLLVEYARLRDLTIMPASDDRWDCEAVIFGSGRPVMVLPQNPPSRLFEIGTVAVAWDFSRRQPAPCPTRFHCWRRQRRSAWLPFSTRSISTTSVPPNNCRRTCRATAFDSCSTGSTPREPIGAVLEAYVASHEVDLLVMGAYGHSRLREFVLGGATKSLLSKPPLPILFSH